MKRTIAALAAAAALASMPMATTQAASNVELGFLDCVSNGGVGFVITSMKEVRCTYTPADKSMPPETYAGTIEKFGLDVGVTGPTAMQWAVFATKDAAYEAGALDGKYVGTSGEVSATAGVGANILVGGNSGGYTLQPVSIQQQAGLNLAVGVSRFELKATAG